MLFSTLVVETGLKSSFPLRAWNEAFFICFIYFFASLSARLDCKREKMNKKTKNAPFHARSGKRKLKIEQ